MSDSINDIDKLRELAETATAGPYEAVCMGSEGYHVVEKAASDGGKRRKRVALCVYEAWDVDKANAEFIAACSPDVIRALVADLVGLRTEVDQLRTDNAELTSRLATITKAHDRLHYEKGDVTAERDALQAEVEKHERIFEAVRDLYWRFVRYGDDKYLVTKGTVHRLIGAMQGNGQRCSFAADDTEFEYDPKADEVLDAAIADAFHQREIVRELHATMAALQARIDAALAEHYEDSGCCVSCVDEYDNPASWPCATAELLGVDPQKEPNDG